MKTFLLTSLVLLVFGCVQKEESNYDREELKEQIRSTENAFRDMAREKGLAEAFVHFADSEAVLYRNGMLIKGKDSIGSWLSNRVTGEMTLDWEPTFIEVSESGDLGYTYGDFIFSSMDSLGKKTESQGVFHTVWKRQKDGSWKYVWD